MDNQYDHYVAVDWSMRNMAIARMTAKAPGVKTMDVPSDVSSLKQYLRTLSGSIILTIEETTTAQWLYTELIGEVSRLIVCDPHRNRLLSEGTKNDIIDATKLVRLLRAGMLKEVYHAQGAFVDLRRLVSGYDDIINAVVRLKNQQSAIIRGAGGEQKLDAISDHERFVLELVNNRIEAYEQDREAYLKKFRELARKHPVIRHQTQIPGIALINSVHIVARVISAQRFPSRGSYWSYCGLIKHEKLSGGKSYGNRSGRYCPTLKKTYKTAAFAALKGDNEFRSYYRHLVEDRGYSDDVAQNAVARRIAQISFGVLKSGKPYHARLRRKTIHENQSGS